MMIYQNLLKIASIYSQAATKEYMKEYMKKRYHAKRREVMDLLGNKCNHCNDTVGPFHIDHIDRRKKRVRANDLHSVNDKAYKKELKNLQLLCVDCHKKKTKDAWDYGMPKPKHGTYWHFRKYKCRCNKCTNAYKDTVRKWKENAKKKKEVNLLDDKPTGSRKVIFLDVDGVLNTNGSGAQMNPELLENLYEIIKATDAWIVVSSAWRQSGIDSNSPFQGVMKGSTEHANYIISRIIGQTPTDDNVSREEQIMQIAKDPRYDIGKFIALDDNPNIIGTVPMFPDIPEWLVQTDPATGLDEDMKNKAINMLNG